MRNGRFIGIINEEEAEHSFSKWKQNFTSTQNLAVNIGLGNV
jgi:hypothetical protein